MHRDLLKHIVLLVQFQWTTETKGRIDVLDWDTLSTYGQDDLTVLVFAQVRKPAGLESEYQILFNGIGETIWEE